VRWATLAVRAGGDAGTAETAEVEEPVVERRRGLPAPLQGLLAFIIYLVVFSLAVGQALISHLTTPSVGQNEVDPNFYIWAWQWWVYAVTHWINPLYSFQIGAPKGYNLAWATTSPSVALFMWPVTHFWGPVVSFNVTLLLAPVASAWGAFVAARRLTGKFWASLPAGAIYGINIYMLAHEVSGQPNLTVNVLFPLMVYLVVQWWEGRLRRVGYVLWMMLAIALEFYTFVEAFAEMSLLWAFAFLIGLVVARHGTRLKLLRLAGFTLAAYLGAIVLAAPYLRYALHNYPSSLTRQDARFSLDLAGLVIPRGDRLLGLHFWLAAAGHNKATTAYLGAPLLVIWLLLVIFHWRSRIAWLLTAGLFVIIALATGPVLSIDSQTVVTWPWNQLWTLPIFKSAEPIRFIVFAYLLLSIALAMWLAALTKSRVLRGLRWLLGTLALAAIFADLPTFAEVVVPPPPVGWNQAMPSLGLPTQIPPFFTDGAYKEYLHRGEIVVIISRRGNAGMLFQADTNFYFKIDGGFINASLSNVNAIPEPVADMSFPTPLRDSAFEEYIRSARVGAIIVEQAWSAAWMYNYDRVGMKPISVGGVTIYQTSTMKPYGNQRIPLFPGVYP
jgi:hypothetical protein